MEKYTSFKRKTKMNIAQSLVFMHKSLFTLVCNCNFVKLKRDQNDLSNQKKKSLFVSYICMGFGGRFGVL